MPHVSSPVLRRLLDEPMAVPDRARRHLADCRRCQAERTGIAENAAVAARLLVAPPQPADVDLEWLLLTERLREPAAAQRPRVSNPWAVSRRLLTASAGTSVAVIAAVLAVAAGAVAAVTVIYAPSRIAPVPVSPKDVRAIESITGLGQSQLAGGLPPSGSRTLAFGKLSWTTAGQPRQVSSIARASALTHLAYSAPARLPAGVGPPDGILIQPQLTATVTFGQQAGPSIAGSLLRITAGPAIVVQYGGRSARPGLTTLVIAVMQRPMASATGATARQLEAFLLSRPALPSGLAQELRLLGSPGTTLPVPVPAGMSVRQLQIGAAPAVLISASGALSGVIWESQDGVVHAVGGLLDARDVVNVARQIG